MPYEASFFDAMSGVKKLINFMHAINVVQFLQTGEGGPNHGEGRGAPPPERGSAPHGPKLSVGGVIGSGGPWAVLPPMSITPTGHHFSPTGAGYHSSRRAAAMASDIFRYLASVSTYPSPFFLEWISFPLMVISYQPVLPGVAVSSISKWSLLNSASSSDIIARNFLS